MHAQKKAARWAQEIEFQLDFFLSTADGRLIATNDPGSSCDRQGAYKTHQFPVAVDVAGSPVDRERLTDTVVQVGYSGILYVAHLLRCFGHDDTESVRGLAGVRRPCHRGTPSTPQKCPPFGRG